ncbi:MAG: FAD-dependent oxidoreductase, partial [Oscillospiraceae bacterium]|nr:FAD-dependent oxidoreductase [Oscillospiraceae bacterium]
CKEYMKKYLRWLIRSAENCGAEIRLNTPVTMGLVEELAPDAVIVATGSAYLRPNIPGINLPHVMMLRDAEQGARNLGSRVLICGGGSAGLECALSLRRRGHTVFVADLLPEEQFAAGMPYFPRLDLLQSLKSEGVTLLPERRVLRFAPEGAVLASPEGETLLPADSCVIAMGVKPRRELLGQLQARYAQGVIPVGDCEGGTNLYDATHTAYFGALRVL